jgi:hypothetical protein
MRKLDFHRRKLGDLLWNFAQDARQYALTDTENNVQKSEKC